VQIWHSYVQHTAEEPNLCRSTFLSLDYILLVQLQTGHPTSGLGLEITKFNHLKHTPSKFCTKAKLQHYENHSQFPL